MLYHDCGNEYRVWQRDWPHDRFERLSHYQFSKLKEVVDMFPNLLTLVEAREAPEDQD
jgi:hypothetical protein